MSSTVNLPIINMRDVVLYPGMQTSLYIGREFTIKAILRAKSQYKGKLIATTQKELENPSPLKRSQIFTVGTVCKLLQCVQFSNGTMKILIEAISPIKLKEVFEEDGVRYGSGVFTRPVKKDTTLLDSKEREEILSLLLRWNPKIALKEDSGCFDQIKKERRRIRFLGLALQIMAIVETKPHYSLTKPERIPKPELLRLNKMIAERQRILEEINIEKQVRIMKSVLKTEILAGVSALEK